MGTFQVQCPHCQNVLSTSLQLRVGTQMQCGKCRTPFVISEANLLSTAATPPPVPAAPAPSPVAAVVPEAKPKAVARLVADAKPKLPTPRDATPPALSTVPSSSEGREGRPLVALAVVALFLFLGISLAIWGLQEGPSEQAEEKAAAQANLLARKADTKEPPAKPDNTVNLPPPPQTQNPPPQTQNPPPPPPPEPVKQEPVKPQPPAKTEPTKPATVEPPPSNTPPPAVALVSPEQKRIDAAIDRGIHFLKSTQQPHGSWSVNNNHVVGYAALPGLTLLECQVPADDPAVQKAAAFVRMNSLNLTNTYELSLVTLFLDRLGDPRDRALIQSLALRLIAGQNFSGGWSYSCPILNVPQMQTLYGILQKERLDAPLPAESNLFGQNPLLLSQGVLPVAIAKTGASSTGVSSTVPGDKYGTKEPKKPIDNKPPRTKPKAPPKGGLRPDLMVVAQLQNLPVVYNVGRTKGRMLLRVSEQMDDNSNSQFAMLALWAARRHDVPSTQSLLLADQRYTQSQNRDGGWGYMVGNGSQPAMTCVGLMGLAMGHGSATPAAAKDNAKAVQDPRIQKGLRLLGNYIPDLPDNANMPTPNLYFMWSLERVAMLYNLDTIGNKEWYKWGVRVLLPNQLPGGSWHSGQYHGSSPTIDTCFALLFLKRSNLVRDLTDNLRLWIAIQDPDRQK